jgi:hypothetical protein
VLTRRTICSRSWASVLGSLRDESILCTSRGTVPVPSFSTRRWLRKSSSLERSRMFMILVGRHVRTPLVGEALTVAAAGAIAAENVEIYVSRGLERGVRGMVEVTRRERKCSETSNRPWVDLGRLVVRRKLSDAHSLHNYPVTLKLIVFSSTALHLSNKFTATDPHLTEEHGMMDTAILLHSESIGM